MIHIDNEQLYMDEWHINEVINEDDDDDDDDNDYHWTVWR